MMLTAAVGGGRGLAEHAQRAEKVQITFSGIRRRVIGTVYLDLDSNTRNTVFLGGSGRSGTTWLSQVINYDNTYSCGQKHHLVSPVAYPVKTLP